MAIDPGNFGYGGNQRSYSFPFAGAGRVVPGTTANPLPDIPCEQVYMRVHPDSTGNIYLGGSDVSSVNGMPFQPGEFIPWTPVKNLNCIWAVADDAASYLQYFIVR